MLRAIAIKELRETVGIAAIALLLYGAIVGYLVLEAISVGSNVQHVVPFVADSFVWNYSWISVALAIALGLRQSAWEGMRGTYLFLLHKPTLAPSIFRQKIVVGLSLLEATAALPIVLYGYWAVSPGTHPTPFEWGMTGPAWCMCLCLPLVYLGAFVAGLRPALWRGTRLLPLVAGLALWFGACQLPWWGAGAAVLAAIAFFWSDVRMVVAQRDFG
jgi:hypothetical protein